LRHHIQQNRTLEEQNIEMHPLAVNQG